MSSARINFLGFSLDAIPIEDLAALIGEKENCHLATCISPESWALAARDMAYADSLKQMEYILCGNEVVAFAYLKLTGKEYPLLRLEPGYAESFFTRMTEQKAKLAIIGGEQGSDDSFHECIIEAFPLLRVKVKFDASGDFEPKISAILDDSIDVVLVDMELGQQEAFLLALKRANYKGLAIACHGLFEAWARPLAVSGWAEKFYARPIFQFFSNTARAKQRYFSDYPFFFRLFLKHWRIKAPSVSFPKKPAV